MKYCFECGADLVPHVVAGEPRRHSYCPSCRQPRHDHPLVIVTCFVAHRDRLLWVRRNLEPGLGLWAIPGGYLESGESLAQGAARELREEAGVDQAPEHMHLYMAGTITFINQVYMGFRTSVDCDATSPGPESQACAYFSREECPWDRLAYPEVNDSIMRAYDDLERGSFGIWHAEMSSDRYTLRAVDEGNSDQNPP